jgi:hypothetical protein
MSRKIETLVDYLKRAGLLVAAALLAATSVLANSDLQQIAQNPGDQRLSESLHFAEGGRANQRNPAKGTSSVDQYAPLETDGARAKNVTRPSGAKAPGATSKSINSDFWIFDVDVQLFNDDDNDGYFYGVDLLFDADTIYDSADVYAAVYLSYEGGPWNEYAVTDDFTIFGTSSSDEFVLVTELMSGYPTGDYDLLIELFDAYDGTFLSSFGPEDTSALAYLPLEDFNRDAPVVEQRVVVVTQSGGGAVGIWLLLALFAVRVLARRKVKV